MSGIIEFANTYLGKFMDIIIPSVLMLLVLTIISVIVGVKFQRP